MNLNTKGEWYPNDWNIPRSKEQNDITEFYLANSIG